MERYQVPALAVCAMMLTSCASVDSLTSDAKNLREIGADATNCRLVASEETNNHDFAQHPGVCKERAIVQMKERVVELGGNAYRYEIRTFNACLFGGTTIAFDAFVCP
jgi:hypothetical protein